MFWSAVLAAATVAAAEAWAVIGRVDGGAFALDRRVGRLGWVPRAIYQYRSFIWRHAAADLRHRFAGTGIGVIWNVLHPLAVIAIYSLVFSTVFARPAGTGAGRLDYTIYLCAGFFPWMAFSDCVMRGCNAFLTNAVYLKKLPIPEQVFVAQTAVASTLSLAVNFAMLLVVALVLGWRPGWTWLLLPIPLLFLQAMGFGLGLGLGTLNVFFRDIAQWVDVLLKLAMWTVPIVYRLDAEPAWLARALAWHPLMPALLTTRQLFMQRVLPPPAQWVGMVTWAMVFCVLGFAVLRKLRPEIRDVI